MRLNTKKTGAFTLIELLVVIAIIGVLIALLMPALGKAKFRARILQCLANERMLGVTVMQYTNDFKGAYPLRQVDAAPAAGDQHYLLAVPTSPAEDDRPLFNKFMNTDKLLVCPFSPLLPGVSFNGTTQFVLTSYDMWFGSRITSLAGGAMLRAGDRPTYFDGTATSTFNVLACDFERDWDGCNGNYNVSTSHPDETGVMTFYQAADSIYIYSEWAYIAPSAAALTRGPEERNFLFDDGSGNTRRLAFRDPSLVRVPATVNPVYVGVYCYLPSMN